MESRGRPALPEIPQNLALPFRLSSRRVGEVPRAGPYAAFLGSEYDPVWTDFAGKATKSHRKTLGNMVFDDNDPYVGLSDDSYFTVPAAKLAGAELTVDRLNTRRSVLQQLNEARIDLSKTLGATSLTKHQSAAMALLESDKLSNALNIRLEDTSTRDLYGRTLFGQSCLAARRLVEAGTRVVSVFWDEYGLAGSGWDTHGNHYPRMRNELCPGFDMGWYGLITDLDRRGMLDETLVVCTSEHGRTPKINKAEGGGRDHWSNVYTTLMAGGGTARGQIVGASDRNGAEVAERPISPKDLLATMYHLMGIDHEMLIRDRSGRPLPLVDGRIINEAIA